MHFPFASCSCSSASSSSILIPVPILILVLILSSCASGPDPDVAGAGGGPFDWNTRPDPAEVQALRERAAPFLTGEGGACLATLVRDRTDVAAALILTEPEAAVREALVVALPPEGRASEAALREGEAVIEAAAQALREGGSPALPAELPTASLRARAAYLALGHAWREERVDAVLVEAALQHALADWAVMQRLEAMRGLGAFGLSPERERTWRRSVATLALERGRPFLAVQQAASARALARTPAEVGADRLLLARAHLAARQGDAALAEAEGARGLVATADERARAESFVGQALLLLGQPREAADAFARAEQAAAAARDESNALRQAINRVTAWLAAGEAALAREAVGELERLTLQPVGPDAPDLLARRSIVAALARVTAGDQEPMTAALVVEVALSRARAAGAVAVLETYSTLPERLRAGKN